MMMQNRMIQNKGKQHPTTGSLVINSKDLDPCFLVNKDNPVPEIVQYLKQMADEKILDENRYLILPSIVSLAQFFQVSSQWVIAALRNLKKDGYFNISGGLYGHISLYGKAKQPSWVKDARTPPWQWLAKSNQDCIKNHLLHVS